MPPDTLPQEAVTITRQLAENLRDAIQADQFAEGSRHQRAFMDRLEEEAREALGDREVDRRLQEVRDRAHTLLEMVCEVRLSSSSHDG